MDRRFSSIRKCFGIYYYFSWIFLGDLEFADQSILFKRCSHSKERGHYVIDKGPYAFMRHPGYAGGTLSYLCIPFAFNSLLALIPAGIFSIAFIIRTYLEDITLQRELQGYVDYAARVRYRLIPGIW
ncbi:MAG: methyltransferase [Nitrospirota bacterium]